MFGRQSEKFPLVDVKTSSGWRIVIGPSAASLILRVVYMLVTGALIFLGSTLHQGGGQNAAGVGCVGSSDRVLVQRPMPGPGQ